MNVSDRLFIDMYAVSHKVESEEFKSEVKNGNESSFCRHFGKNGQKWDFGSSYLKNSPRYDIDISVVFDKVDDV